MGKIKKRETKIVKACTNCFTPKYLKFNFSFITFNEANKEDTEQLLKRLMEISKEPYLVVANWDKSIGFENVKVDISKEISPNFEDGNRRFDGKYTIMRLYTNNNPTPGRIIGKLINHIFYIFYIDPKGKLYNH